MAPKVRTGGSAITGQAAPPPRNIQKALYLHRKRPGSITQTFSRKNIQDRNLAFSHLDRYIQDHTPDIFSEEQRKKKSQLWLNWLMKCYAKKAGYSLFSEKLREEIIAAGKKIGIRTCGIRTRTAYHMICFCPWLFKIIYPFYHPVRLLVYWMTRK